MLNFVEVKQYATTKKSNSYNLQEMSIYYPVSTGAGLFQVTKLRLNFSLVPIEKSSLVLNL